MSRRTLRPTRYVQEMFGIKQQLEMELIAIRYLPSFVDDVFCRYPFKMRKEQNLTNTITITICNSI